jgi:hypothetical protein
MLMLTGILLGIIIAGAAGVVIYLHGVRRWNDWFWFKHLN